MMRPGGEWLMLVGLNQCSSDEVRWYASRQHSPGLCRNVIRWDKGVC